MCIVNDPVDIMHDLSRLTYWVSCISVPSSFLVTASTVSEGVAGVAMLTRRHVLSRSQSHNCPDLLAAVSSEGCWMKARGVRGHM